MNQQDLKTEWQYRYDERIAILCGQGDPTPEQHKQALREADEVVEKMKGTM